MFIFGGRRINPMEYLHGMEVFAQEADIYIKKGNELEKEGRDIASDSTGLIGSRDEDWLKRLQRYLKDLSDFLYDIAPLLDLPHDLYRETYLLGNRVEAIYMGFTSLGLKGKPRSIRFLNPKEVGESTAKQGKRLIDNLLIFEEIQKKWTGMKGIWLWGEIPPENYSWSAFINDLTSSFHRFLEYIATTIGEYSALVDKVYVHPDANPYLIELAKSWYNSINLLNNFGLVVRDDFEPTVAYVRESEMDIRVGSAAGHLTHIELRPLGILVSYYDRDDNVRDVIGRLARDYGCYIIQDVEGQRLDLFCSRLTGAAENFMKYVLPFATSMDIRMYNPFNFWSGHIPDFKKKFKEMIQYAEPEDIEYWACKWFIENKLKILLEERTKKVS